MFLPESKTNVEELLTSNEVEDHTCYLVDVSWNKSNPVHEAVLFMGFKETLGYCEIYNNCYETPSNATEAYYLKIKKKLYKFK